MDFASKIRTIENFPKEGVSFKDITTLFQDPEAFKAMIDTIKDRYKDEKIDTIVGIESRGFLVGAPLAYALGAGFVLVRKPGKLPCKVERVEYELEYGTDALEIHSDALKPGERVLICDDLLATGGTTKATIELVKKLGAEVVSLAFIIELTYLNGREKLEGYDIYSLVKY
ncbi:MAG: adenine phosphoribosyltransferase [Bacillota bacterium]|nr:adenine phosphoribosyltransferase [Bacillota bacterium]NLU54215.1 adenine phosphoribosyltransferase [Bacillota bacterium]HOA90925.1 adenine phosphoribosyltransferase [Bacillota bacterium]HOJ46336.1 adenine phosphoribosyltransferase [Bacillota bacterium]HOP53143.1 adenine phosphoribosyltransferase [Bacillota bacterium]